MTHLSAVPGSQMTLIWPPSPLELPLVQSAPTPTAELRLGVHLAAPHLDDATAGSPPLPTLLSRCASRLLIGETMCFSLTQTPECAGDVTACSAPRRRRNQVAARRRRRTLPMTMDASCAFTSVAAWAYSGLRAWRTGENVQIAFLQLRRDQTVRAGPFLRESEAWDWHGVQWPCHGVRH